MILLKRLLFFIKLLHLSFEVLNESKREKEEEKNDSLSKYDLLNSGWALLSCSTLRTLSSLAFLINFVIIEKENSVLDKEALYLLRR